MAKGPRGSDKQLFNPFFYYFTLMTKDNLKNKLFNFRDEKVKVLKAVQELTMDDVVLGQYQVNYPSNVYCKKINLFFFDCTQIKKTFNSYFSYRIINGFPRI